MSERRRPQMLSRRSVQIEEVTYASEAAGVKTRRHLDSTRGERTVPSGPHDLRLGRRIATRRYSATSRSWSWPMRSRAEVSRYYGVTTGGSDDQPAILPPPTIVDFADDVRGGVAYLKGRPEINPRNIGLLGHSEGGVIGPMVAARTPGDIAFLVLLAPAPASFAGDRLAVAQTAAGLRAAGASEDTINRSNELAQVAPADRPCGEGRQASRSETSRWGRSVVKEAVRIRPQSEGNSAELFAQHLASPSLRYWLRHDTQKELARVKCPVLALNGELDSQVPYKENLEGIAMAVKGSGNVRVTTRSFPKLNHLFQTSETGSMMEYGRIEETIAPVVIQTITEWVVEQARKR